MCFYWAMLTSMFFTREHAGSINYFVVLLLRMSIYVEMNVQVSKIVLSLPRSLNETRFASLNKKKHRKKLAILRSMVNFLFFPISLLECLNLILFCFKPFPRFFPEIQQHSQWQEIKLTRNSFYSGAKRYSTEGPNYKTLYY